MKFSEVANEWFEYQQIGLSYSYKKVLKINLNHINDFIGDMEVSHIKSSNIQKIIIKYANENPHTHKPSSKKLLKTILQITINVFEYAIDNQYVNCNPARKIKLPAHLPKGERKAITEYEQKLIMLSTHRAALPAKIMMLCGLRKGEIIPLTWDDINFDNHTIKVSKSASISGTNRYLIKHGTKNGKSRIVTMPEILTILLSQEKDNSYSQYVSSMIDGRMHTPTSFDRMWESFEKSLNHQAYLDRNKNSNKNYYDPKGIPKIIQHITPHMLRHTYATLLYSAKVDMLTASKLMGHANIETTLSIYTHLEEQTMIMSIDNLNSFLSKLYV